MTEIARGTIKIDLDDTAAMAGLRAVNNEFERTMHDIEREKATASVDLNIEPLKDKVNKAKRELKVLKGEKASIKVDGDTKEIDAKIDKVQRKIAKLDGKKATVEMKLKGTEAVDKQYAKIEKLAAKQAAAEQKYLRSIDKLEQQSEARRLAGVRYQARVSKSLRDQEQRELNQAHQWALRINKEMDAAKARSAAAEQARMKALHTEALAMNKRMDDAVKAAAALKKKQYESDRSWAQRLNTEMDKANADQLKAREQEADIRRKLSVMRDKELADLPRMQREYVELAQHIEKLAVARRRGLGDPRQTQVVDFKIAESEAKMKALKATLERIGGPIDLDVNIHPGRRFGTELRAALQERTITGSAEHAGIIMGARLYSGFQNQVQKKFSKQAIAGLGARTFGRIGDVFNSLASATVRLGPFTATLRQLGLVMAVLGPTILDVVGAMGSLVSVAGAGVAGAAVIGTGAVTGLGLSFLGLKFSTRNTGQEIQNLRTYINAVQKAQEKYGPTAGKTIKAQRELNHAMHEVSPLAAQTAQGIEKFYTDWDKHTATTQKNLGNIAKHGFSALDSIVPMWTKRTNQLSGILDKGLGGAFDFIKKGQGKGLLDGILGDFNRTLPSVLRGLGRFGESFLRIGREGAKYLPMVGRGFADIGDKLLAFTKSDKFGPTVKRWVDSARNLVTFFGAAGRVVMHFFGAGVNAGNDFVRSMTDGLNKWDEFLTSAQGKNTMGDFFKQSVTGAEALFHAIAPIGAAFVTWAHNLSPIVTGFLQGTGAVTNFVGQLVKLVGLQGSIGTIAATLGALWSINKISGATRGIIGFTQALLGMKAAQTAVAVSGGLGGGVGGLTKGSPLLIGGVASSAERAAPALTKMGKAAAVGGRGLTLLGGAAGFANPYVGAAILAAGGAYVAYRLLTRGTRDAKKALEEGGAAAKGAAEDYRQNTTQLADTATAHQRAAIAVRQARSALKDAKKGTDDYKLAQLNLNDALRTFAQTGDNTHRANTARIKDAENQVKAEQKRLDAFDKLNESDKRQAEYDQKFGQFAQQRQLATQKLADIEKGRAKYVDLVNAALNRQAAVSANTARATANMTPILGQAEQKLGQLARLSKSTAVKIALKFDAPKDVSKVAASASATLRSGVPAKIVTRIVADSSNADQAVRKLQAARIDEKKFNIIAAGGIPALGVLERIAGRKLTTKEQKIVTSGQDGAMRVLAKILGIKLGTKNQRIMETGSSTVVGALAKILGIKIPEKRTRATVDASGAFGPINSVISSMNSIPNVTRTVTIRTQRVGAVGKGADTTASGTAPGKAKLSWVGEGRRWQGAPEIIANQRTGQTHVVSKPTLMELSKDDYVIPTEPAFAAKGRGLWEEFQRGLGISRHYTSRKPKLPKLIGAKAKDPDNLAEVKKYNATQVLEDNKNKQIQIAERRVKEPDSFLKSAGKDSLGNDLFTVDQGVITTYSNQLGDVKKLQEELIGKDPTGIGGIMGDLKAAATAAFSALGAYRKNRKTNISQLQNAQTRDKKLAGSSNKDTAKAAKARLSSEKSEIAKQQSMFNDSVQTTKEISDDQTDANISRIPGYQLDLQDTTQTIIDIGAQAAAQASAANPQPPAPEPPPVPEPEVGAPGGPTVGENAISKLETEKALAGIGIGINGQPPRSIADINSDLIAANTSRMAEGQALLMDATTSNDAEGYSIIQQAAGAITSLRDEIKQASDAANTTAAGVIAEHSAFSSAILDLFRNSGSNFSGTSANVSAAMRAPMSAPTPGSGTGAPGGAGAAGSAPGISIVQNFPTQPDPMTWAAQTSYELAAAL